MFYTEEQLTALSYNELTYIWLNFGGTSIAYDEYHIVFPSFDEMVEDILFSQSNIFYSARTPH